MVFGENVFVRRDIKKNINIIGSDNFMPEIYPFFNDFLPIK